MATARREPAPFDLSGRVEYVAAVPARLGVAIGSNSVRSVRRNFRRAGVL